MHFCPGLNESGMRLSLFGRDTSLAEPDVTIPARLCPAPELSTEYLEQYGLVPVDLSADHVRAAAAGRPDQQASTISRFSWNAGSSW